MLSVFKDIADGAYGIAANYIRASYQNDPFRVLLEGFLLVFVIWYLGKNALKPNSDELVKLTPREIDELIDEWQPEPLVNAEQLSRDNAVEDEMRDPKLEFCSGTDFLGFRKIDAVKQAAIAAVRTYGVGTCGPAGFYGTLDVHQTLQSRLAELLGVQSALVLAQGYSAVAGVIPAFAKRNDIVVVDDGVCFAVQRGIALSRARVHYYKHNDTADLRRTLQSIVAAERGKYLTRRFLITEGLFQKSGEIVDLPEVMRMKEEFRFRLILDDSAAFGVLGPRGLGTCDHYGLDASDVILVASLSQAIGACGGFTAGKKEIIDHQVLSNQAYCYSASLPALFATSTLKALDLLPSRIPELHKEVRRFDEAYHRHARDFSLRGFVISGHVESPLRFLHSSSPDVRNDTERAKVDALIARMKREGYQLARRILADADEIRPSRPAVKICIGIGMDTAKLMPALARALA